MTTDDDDALSWGGEVDDSSHVEGVADERADREAPGNGVAATSTTAGSSVLLVAYGIIGGVYLLFVVGWIVGVQRDGFTAATLFFEIMYQFGGFLAIASPVLWFIATFVLTRGRRPGIRLGWLLAGMLLLAPWPFILSGNAA